MLLHLHTPAPPRTHAPYLPPPLGVGISALGLYSALATSPIFTQPSWPLIPTIGSVPSRFKFDFHTPVLDVPPRPLPFSLLASNSWIDPIFIHSRGKQDWTLAGFKNFAATARPTGSAMGRGSSENLIARRGRVLSSFGCRMLPDGIFLCLVGRRWASARRDCTGWVVQRVPEGPN